MRVEEAKAFFCIFSKSYIGAFLEEKKKKEKEYFFLILKVGHFPFIVFSRWQPLVALWWEGAGRAAAGCRLCAVLVGRCWAVFVHQLHLSPAVRSAVHGPGLDLQVHACSAQGKFNRREWSLTSVPVVRWIEP